MLAYGAVQTQWNYSPRGAPLGLRYEGCLPVLEQKRQYWVGQGVVDVPEADTLFEDLRVIESAFIIAHGERRASAEAPANG